MNLIKSKGELLHLQQKLELPKSSRANGFIIHAWKYQYSPFLAGTAWLRVLRRTYFQMVQLLLSKQATVQFLLQIN